MIYTERSITVRIDEASMNYPIVLYRGDRKVEIKFYIYNAEFRFSNKSNLIISTNAYYAQLAIMKPDGTGVFSDIQQTEDGCVLFEISGDMIDQIEEVGCYSFHIRLFDESLLSRVTLPHISDGIQIKEPIIIENIYDNIVGAAIVGYSKI